MQARLFGSTLILSAIALSAPARAQPTALNSLGGSGTPAVAAVTVTAKKPNSVLVTMNCVIQNDGTLGDCKVISEEPRGSDYAVASLKAAKRFRMKTMTPNGRSTAGTRVVIPIRWMTE